MSVSVMVALLPGMTGGAYAASREKKEASREMSIISLGGGRFQGQSDTSAIGALETAYAKGMRTMRVSFMDTSDGELICGRNWKSALQPGASSKPGGLNRQEFQAIPASRRACTLFELAEWMKKRPEVTILANMAEDMPIEDYKTLISSLPDAAARVWPVIRGQKYCEDLGKMGFEKIVWDATRFRLEAGPEYVEQVLEGCPVSGVIVTAEQLQQPDFPDALRQPGLPLLAYAEQCQEVWNLMLYRVDAYLSVRLNPADCTRPKTERFPFTALR